LKAMTTKVKTKQEIEAMRAGGRMLATILVLLTSQVKVGITTKDLAEMAAKELKKLGGQPAFLNYQGYPEVICTSINEEVVHGIPSKNRVLKNGDILGLDFGVLYQGLITDAAVSVIVGTTKNQKH